MTVFRAAVLQMRSGTDPEANARDFAALVEEAVTTTGTLLERLGALKNTSGYFGHRGWALGWGLGCALGVKLAWSNRPVLALLGEGAAMYGIQGLWSAAHHHLPVTFVICNNAQYQILKVGARGLGLSGASEGQYEGMDLTGPEIDFVALAQSMGVEARRISDRTKAALAAYKARGGVLRASRPECRNLTREARRKGAKAAGMAVKTNADAA